MVPGPTAVTTPFFTVTTSSLFDDQVKFLLLVSLQYGYC